MLEEIDGHAFRRQQRPYIASYNDNLRVRLDGGPDFGGLDDAQRGVHGEEDFLRDGDSGNGHRLVRHNGGPGLNRAGKQRTRGDVAVGEIFVEGQLDRFADGLLVKRLDFVSAR